MELLQDLTNNFKITDLGKEQGQFMNNMMNSVMNTALDIGLRALLPDLIEQQVIDIKNSLFSEGLQEGINTAINSLKDFAKSALGIVTGDFENISQVQNAVEKGGIFMELGQELTNNFKISNIGKEQGQFMNNMMNSVMNTALDIGLRALLPDLIEQQVIDIKNSLFS